MPSWPRGASSNTTSRASSSGRSLRQFVVSVSCRPADAFAGMGVPAPQASALFAALVELAGGAALIVGVATPIAGLLLALDMLGAFLLVHAGNGVFIDRGGFELVAALGAAALVLAATGAGRVSVDHVVAARRRAARRSQPAPLAGELADARA